MSQYSESGRTDAKSGEKGKFFAVAAHDFHFACELGMNQALAYLVCACGSGKDNATSKWSVNALHKYCGVSRLRGKAAFDGLLHNGLLKLKKGGKHPIYTIPKTNQDDWIWLPNALITGAVGETPPVERVRETSDVMILRLLVDLYGHAYIAEEGGVARSIVRVDYKRSLLVRRGEYAFYGFDRLPQTCFSNHEVVKPHLDSSRGDTMAQPFFERVRTLVTIGLLQWVPTLFDSPDGEVIYALQDPFSSDAAPHLESIARDLLAEMRPGLDSKHDQVAAVLSHFLNPVVFDVLVPRYRQKTRVTAQGFAASKAREEYWRAKFAALGSSIQQGAISRLYQGLHQG